MASPETALPTEERRIPGTPITNQQVEAELRKIRQSLRLSPEFQNNDVVTHLRLARLLSQQGDPNGAIEEYQAVIRLQPDSAVAYRELGAVFIDKHEWRQAENALERSTQFDQANSQSYYWLGRTLMAQHDFDQAEVALTRASRLDPLDAETYSDLGLVLMAQGKTHKAQRALSQAIHLQPDFAEAHHRLEQIQSFSESSHDLIQSAEQILHTLFRRE